MPQHRTRSSHAHVWLAMRSAGLLLLCYIIIFTPSFISATPVLTIQTITWDIIGLDSNNVTVGPDTFPVAARVCNTGTTTATNVVSAFIWDSSNAYINLSGASTLSTPSLDPTACKDFYYSVVITRDPAAYLNTRSYHITATADGLGTISTPIPRELYVEKLLSQARNDVLSISGPTTVYIGGTYQYVLDSDTATNGYEQLETFLNFPNTVFEILKVETSYTAPPGATNDTVYANACGWDANPTSPTYRSCVGPAQYPGGKAGGRILTTYTVRILAAGTATLSNLIHDFSGSSYHYNADFGQSPNTITITAVSPLSVLKADSLLIDADGNGAVNSGDTLQYTITMQNLGTVPITGILFNDTPDPNTLLVVPTVTTTQGSVTRGNTAGDTSVEVNIGTLGASATASISFRVTVNNPLPTNITQVANQGVASSNELPPTLTDDPDTPITGDPTRTPLNTPTAIELSGFTATQRSDAVEIVWITSAEINTWGFHLYRSADGSRASALRITPQIILARGRGQGGASYSWKDSSAPGGESMTYWLQEIELDGSVNEYGPAAAKPQITSSQYQIFLPLINS